MATVYILYSESAGEFYTGSSKDIDQRYEYHMMKEFPASHTAKYDDWELFFTIDNLEIGLAKKI
jgi:predicted GIY-YIG superfamily endonuclease